jgi:hypothetical protein
MKIDSTYTEQMRTSVAQQLPNIVPAADASRRGSLTAALAVHSAQQTSLTINRARSAAKYGPSSDQVAAMDLRLAANTQSTQAVQSAQARAQLQAPAVPAGSAGIFGRVVDPNGNAVYGASVAAVSDAGTAGRKASTDDSGRYQLLLPVRGSKTARTAASDRSAVQPSISVHLEVSMAGKVVLTDSETLTLHSGDTVMRELVAAAPGAPDMTVE